MTFAIRNSASAILVAGTLALSLTASASSGQDGIVRVKSAYSVEQTVALIKDDVAEKGIRLFDVIDQAQLAREAGIELRPSTLIVFGNPPLGTQFITARPEAGLDWPVRVLVYQDAKGQVWAAYTDFQWIARRHNIKNRKAQFNMASQVIGSITSTIKPKQ
jgi:uncharacterized protein (DUF302 family)